MALEERLADLTDEKLDEKIQKLTRIAFSNNINLARQAQPILLNLYEEQSRRNAERFEKHLEKSGVKVDDIINIGNE
jgi:hypothetical protein